MSTVDIHVNQSIQTAGQDVPLVHGKATLIRVFINSKNRKKLNDSNSGFVTGTLLARLKGGTAKNRPTISLRPINPLMISKISLESSSRDLDSTLNFVMKSDDWKELGVGSLGDSKQTDLEFSIDKLQHVGAKKALTNLKINAQSVAVNRPIKMRLRAIAYRYTEPETGEWLEPSENAIHEVKNFVDAAFPVSELEWSWNVVEAPETFVNLRNVHDENARAEEKIDFNYQVLFQHLLALRTTEINSSDADDASDAVRPNTVYIGLISDPTHRFGGASMDSPEFATAQVVACCEATHDGELAAHEIAHTLGCEHPGFPDKEKHGRFLGQTNQERNSDVGLGGEILNRNNQGYGVRFLSGSSLPQLIAPNRFYDLMTYRSPKWVSPMSYLKIMERLDTIYKDEGENYTKASSGYFTVIGAYNLLNRDATVQFVLPSKQEVYPQDDNGEPLVNNPDPGLMALVAETKPGLGEGDTEETGSEPERRSPIYIRSNPERTDANNSIGIFQHSIKNDSDSRVRYRLTIRGQPVEIVDHSELGDLLKVGIENDPVYQLLKSTEESTEESALTNLEVEFINEVVNNLINTNGLVTVLSTDTAYKNIFEFRYNIQKGSLHLIYNWRKFFESESNEFFKQFSIPIPVPYSKGEKFYSSVSALGQVLERIIENYRKNPRIAPRSDNSIEPEGLEFSQFEQQSINLKRQDVVEKFEDLEAINKTGSSYTGSDPDTEKEIASLELFKLTLDLLKEDNVLSMAWITSFFALAKVPITTIVQIKHQSSAGTDKGKWDRNNYVRQFSKDEDGHLEKGHSQYKPVGDLDRWETIYISKRLANQDVWIPDRYLQSSLSHYSGNNGQYGLPKFIKTSEETSEDNSKKINSYEALFNFSYRVQLAIGGYSITMFDNSKSGSLTATVPDRLHGHRFNSGQEKEVSKRPAPSLYDARVDFHPILAERNSK